MSSISHSINKTYSTYSKNNNIKRGFMGSNSRIINHISQSFNNNSYNHNNTSINDTKPNAILWGTNFDVKEVEKNVNNFIIKFQNELKEYIYYEKLKDIRIHENYNITIEAKDILKFDSKLYSMLIFYPAETIIYFDKIVNDIYREYILSDIERNNLDNIILTRIIELNEKTIWRDLGPKDINHFISISGIVIRTSNTIPEMKEACFKCTICSNLIYQFIERGRINEPNECLSCNTKKSFLLIHNQCNFTDKQYIKLQETPESIPEGDTPNYITLICYDDIVDTCKPGDKVEITGIYRVQGVRISKFNTNIKNTFKNYIDIVSISRSKRNDNEDAEDKFYNVLEDEIKNYKFSSEEKIKFKEFAKDKNIYNNLIKNFAPSIWEYDHVKLGLLCQLFGGSEKNLEYLSRGRFRNDINILLVGDPSTAKSQLLKFVNSINIKGIYTSGKGTSAVGLTASISKDSETKELILQSGALILSDKGICCIDEFDKMDDSTKSILHEVMEQQTISIAKAGVVCTLNARTSILAAANPKESKYNSKKSIIYNLETPPTLLSRFDLIYLMLDKKSNENDKKLADHILSLYTSTNDEIYNQNNFNKLFLKKYIQFCKNECNPELTEEAEAYLLKCYLEMRSLGNNKNIITATPRQLESLIRISEALAKMKLSQNVSKAEVIKAYELIKEATQKTALDPTTGLIDMNKIITGFSSHANTKISNLVDIIKNIIKLKEELYKVGVKGRDLLIELNKNYSSKLDIIENIEMIEALKLLEEESLITVSGNLKKSILIKWTNIN